MRGVERSIEFVTATGILVVTVRELTVAEIRTRLAGEVAASTPAPLAVDVMLWGEDPTAPTVLPQDIFDFSDLTPEASERLTVSQRREVVALVKQVNADFFGLRDGWGDIVARLQAARQPLSENFSDPLPA